VQPLADIVREGNRLGITEDSNRLAGSIYYQPAVRTSGQMLFEIDSYTGVNGAVQITR
jgi:hypothetical protein